MSTASYANLLRAVDDARTAASAERSAWVALDKYDNDAARRNWRDAERRLNAAKGGVLFILETMTGADWGAT